MRAESGTPVTSSASPAGRLAAGWIEASGAGWRGREGTWRLTVPRTLSGDMAAGASTLSQPRRGSGGPAECCRQRERTGSRVKSPNESRPGQGAGGLSRTVLGAGFAGAALHFQLPFSSDPICSSVCLIPPPETRARSCPAPTHLPCSPSLCV